MIFYYSSILIFLLQFDVRKIKNILFLVNYMNKAPKFLLYIYIYSINNRYFINILVVNVIHIYK